MSNYVIPNRALALHEPCMMAVPDKLSSIPTLLPIVDLGDEIH